MCLYAKNVGSLEDKTLKQPRSSKPNITFSDMVEFMVIVAGMLVPV